MATACTTVTCPTTCGEPLPEGAWSLCAPVINVGEIEEILYTNIGFPLTDETSAAEWADRKALLTADEEKIRSIFCKAEKPKPEVTEIEISRNTKVVTNSNNKITGQVFETNQTNYELYRKMQCPRKVLIWFRTAGGLLYGGASGIEATIKLQEIIPLSRKDLIVFDLEVSYDGIIPPCRTTSPF